jgi:omega-amidase
MQDLRISFIQTALFWEDVPKNLAHFNEKLAGLKGKQEIILLPEMFNSGFTVKPEKIAETPGSATMRWMKEKALEMDCVIAGTLIVKDGGYFYNRLIWMRPDGSFETYDKRHLFRMGNEHLRFSSGRQKVIIDHQGWKICPLVCYDLRFPIWSKNHYIKGLYQYDVLIFLANWPAKRKKVWKSLLPARAIENLSYAMGVNRIGKDGNGMAHSGDSMLVGPKGDILARAKPGQEETMTIVLHYKDLESVRRNFNVGPDWDQFRIDL